ncbi:M16 family metallopeptidase [Echinicola vietnamensis]|uniref:Putative Zn-dependent peptidase n=1 Tax=Echinicola vietnamensis (strain DSM 17526 / LMG 23754 / KMM 6221) TaxID=926556 RepID=L0FWT4_ECHVK|nr:pitrilysin family protein [Echinicola vietnamensis]AGA77772.1 putative Zn-dependent peptidase [Echinicola vietnamensis DSM 17526]
MINYEHYVLDNGLQVLIHPDHSTKMAVTNIIYKVGSRNEVPGKTGLAHYFEHLMFGGSKNVPQFDSALERVGGECNAFTNTDITNYYITLPATNIETAFWLESDRMLQLNLGKKTVETQRKVVIEEFKQRYLNQPYGDAMHLLRGLCYDVHPYQWPTIGKEIKDIEGFDEEDIRAFYQYHYAPNNAILVIAGDVKEAEVLEMAKKWFGPIPAAKTSPADIPEEPKQTHKRTLYHSADVPTDALYKAYHMPGRMQKGYLECDLITDILGFGRSSLLEQRLVKNTDIFASCHGYILGALDPGLMVFSGNMEKGKTAEEAEKLLDEVVQEFIENTISQETLDKVKNQAEAMKTYESIQLINRAMTLAYYTQLGSPDIYQIEYDRKTAICADQISDVAREVIQEPNASVLYYKSDKH